LNPCARRGLVARDVAGTVQATEQAMDNEKRAAAALPLYRTIER
jgi:hypothetical protein